MRALLVLIFLFSFVAGLFAEDDFLGMDRMTRTAPGAWLVPYPRVGKRSGSPTHSAIAKQKLTAEKRLYLARVGKRAYMYAARVGK